MNGRITVTVIIFLLSLSGVHGQSKEARLKITHLTEDFYVFTTFGSFKGLRITANGMYVVTTAGVVLFDTPWDTTQFQPLLDSIRVRHGKDAILNIATHFHDDRTAGLEYYRQKGIKTYTTRTTDEMSRQRGQKRAMFLIDKDTSFNIGQYSFQTYFPGEGHTKDNIVIWFEREKILYGGCLIKSTMDHDLGNLSDANVKAYPETIRNIQRKCKNPKYIITGHDDWSSVKSLDHTLRMAVQLQKSENH